jgi:hypothetical protein
MRRHSCSPPFANASFARRTNQCGQEIPRRGGIKQMGDSPDLWRVSPRHGAGSVLDSVQDHEGAKRPNAAARLPRDLVVEPQGGSRLRRHAGLETRIVHPLRSIAPWDTGFSACRVFFGRNRSWVEGCRAAHDTCGLRGARRAQPPLGWEQFFQLRRSVHDGKPTRSSGWPGGLQKAQRCTVKTLDQ